MKGQKHEKAEFMSAIIFKFSGIYDGENMINQIKQTDILFRLKEMGNKSGLCVCMVVIPKALLIIGNLTSMALHDYRFAGPWFRIYITLLW